MKVENNVKWVASSDEATENYHLNLKAPLCFTELYSFQLSAHYLAVRPTNVLLFHTSQHLFFFLDATGECFLMEKALKTHCMLSAQHQIAN